MTKQLKFFHLSVIAAALLLSAGCIKKETVSEYLFRPGTSSNEVLTLTPVPEDKQLITMRSQDGVDHQLIERAIETKFNMVDIVVVNNTPEYLALSHQDIEDIYLSTYSDQKITTVSDLFIDLSSESFLSNYYLSALNDCSQNGRIYYLPGPSRLYGIVYNKTLFEEMGWELPSNQEEFIELCRTIEAQGIRAIQPALFYSDAVRQFFSGFTYSEVYASIDDYRWLQEYQKGQASMTGHMEPAFSIMQRFIDSGVLRAEDFHVRPIERSHMFYKDWSCAMILENQLAPVYAREFGNGQEQKLGMLPFYSSSSPDSDYLLLLPSFYISANKKLLEPGNEEKYRLVLDIIEYLSTVEGQQAIINQESPMFSSVQGITLTNTEFISDILPTIEKGHVHPQPFFIGNTNSFVDNTLKEGLEALCRGELVPKDIMDSCDAARDAMLHQRISAVSETVGTALTDFTILEFSEYLADLFRKKAEAQIGLCLSNTRTYGNNMKLYAGTIEIEGNKAVSPGLNRCFPESSAADGYGSKLMLAEITGENLINILNNVVIADLNYPNAYYVSSGLIIEFAPWAGTGNRIVNVTLEDGSELKPDAVYTVAFWNGSVNPDYVSNILQTYDDSIVKLFKNAVLADKKIQPFSDGRFTLNWNIVEE